MQISFPKIKDSLKGLVGRFPMTVVFSILMLGNLYVYSAVDEDFSFYSSYFLSMGMVISLFFELWEEEVSNKRMIWILWGVAILLALTDATVLYAIEEKMIHLSLDDRSVSLARASIFVALLCGCVCISFLRNRDDIQLWNFGAKLCLALVITMVVTGIMVLGVSLLFWGFSELFSVHIDDVDFIRVLLPFLVLLPVFLFLLRIPLSDKHDDSLLVSDFISGVTRYLFIPLILCYMVVLYGYLFKILFSWELPKGTVTWMVTVMMGGMIIVELLLYPFVVRGDNKFKVKVAKLLPWFMLPLLVLMSVGIGRRVSDYGITPDRLYVILANVWCYLVCFYFIINRNKRILWVPLSFCLFFLLSSAQPFNFFFWTKHVRIKAVTEVVERYAPEKLPMDECGYLRWLSGLPEKERENVNSSLSYLQKTYSEQITRPWVDFQVYFDFHYQSLEYYMERECGDMAVVKTVAEKSAQSPAPLPRLSYDYPVENIAIPQGYKTVQYISHVNLSSQLFNDKSQLTDTVADFVIALDTVALRENNGEMMVVPVASDTNFIFVPIRVNLGVEAGLSKLDMKGYIFGK